MRRRFVRHEGMDPETDFRRIYHDLGSYEFPWDMVQSLSFALFRTYAVPSIGALLDRTAEFSEHGQKRYDDTVLLLDEPIEHGLDSDRGRAAIRRINQMHRRYAIPNDDMRYVLSTFVVVPKRWIDDYGWRRLRPAEIEASVHYYRALGARMGIRDIPADYAGFEALLDSYEAAHFGYDEGARRVADSTLDLLGSFYPRPLAPLMNVFSRSLMDDALLDAFRFRRPPRPVRALARLGMRGRARFVALLPARSRPVQVGEWKRIRSYPRGYDIDALGTFAPGASAAGCPATSSAAPARAD